MYITRLCDFCQEEYQAEQRYLNRGQGTYCSRKCSQADIGKKRLDNRPSPNVSCAYCQKEFYLSPSKQKNSKSGLFFCCREHKDLAQRIGGIKEIQPPHYGDELKNYRQKAFATYKHECKNCGYNKYLEVLEVNHIDCDRSNNNIENLEILCPTCHTEFHFLSRTGPWYQYK